MRFERAWRQGQWQNLCAALWAALQPLSFLCAHGLLGREWVSGMRILLVNAVRDPCPGVQCGLATRL